MTAAGEPPLLNEITPGVMKHMAVFHVSFCPSLQEREALKVIPLKEIHKVQECKQRSVKVT